MNNENFEAIEKLESIEASAIKDVNEVTPLECGQEQAEVIINQEEINKNMESVCKSVEMSGCSCSGSCGSNYSMTGSCSCSGSCGSNYHK